MYVHAPSHLPLHTEKRKVEIDLGQVDRAVSRSQLTGIIIIIGRYNIFLSVWLPTCLPVCLSVHYLSIDLAIYHCLSICLSVVYLSVYSFVYPSVHPSCNRIFLLIAPSRLTSSYLRPKPPTSEASGLSR